MQVEMKDYDDLIRRAWLIEAVLDVAETDIHLLPFSRRVPQSVLMDLQISNGLLANKVRSNYKIVELVSSGSLIHNQLFKLLFAVDGLNFLCRFVGLDLAHAFFDLLRRLKQSVVCTCRCGFKSQLFNQHVVLVFHLRELDRSAVGGVEVDSQVGPLALHIGRHALNG